ncbi:sugar ABC transporter substrate-binding protein [Arthrobacter psychrolactophilus]|uniref:Sugar ABC transporter substrate-binding protein n=1 Tax=Arthrobacter psychrolactophilus TaxID=92442 RepID=A0A2V5JMR7_9MICC|nr:sugar ABC transporter substrate-binding protein [Arthrobacter psychrolactophilus]PYI39476.1 sugar ABC transporter substrate-binding protein [Arthrobacter psychrolactophilus]
MKKKSLAVLGVALAAVLAMTGCGSTTPTDSSGNEKVTVKYSNFISNGGNEKNLDAIVQSFEKANPNITVEVSTLPYSDYATALQTDLAAGTQADTFDIEYANLSAFVADGVLAPLDGVEGSKYKQSLLESYQSDGKQYALPSSFSDVVLYYNKDLFDAAGVDYPSSDWTWADETAAAKKITNASSGVFGDFQNMSFYEFYKVLAQTGGKFLNDDGKSVAFNSPAGIRAAQWLADKSGTTMPTTAQGAGTADFDTQLFKDGKLGMLHSGTWIVSSFAETTANWDIAVEPGDTQKASAVFSNAIGVSSSSKNKEAAQKWAEYMTSSEIMAQTRITSGWELPPTSDETVLQQYLTQGKPDNRQAVFDALIDVVNPPVIGANQQQMADIITNALGEIEAKRSSAADALKDAESQINTLLN